VIRIWVSFVARNNGTLYVSQASTNPLERQQEEIKRRTSVVGIFPNRQSLIRLAGALMAENDDEWATDQRRYFSIKSMRRFDEPEGGEVHQELVAALV
jgi:transposase-like protein